MTLSDHAVDFIDDARLSSLLEGRPDRSLVRETIAKSLSKQALSVAETAALLQADDPALVEEIFAAARRLKRDVYGNRIVLFAPLYVGNQCVNDCLYCGFRRSNPQAVRRTLDREEIRRQIAAMVSRGHKRTILVFGEHPAYDAEFIADCVRVAYAVQVGHGNMRRIHINAAPMDHEGYRIIKAAQIGTYQIFQETYHHATYAALHPRNTRKADYLWRLDGVARAMEVGQDDVGIGALFGLYDWRFEVLGLVSHAVHLQKTYGCGPHTISFPRLRPASGVHLDERWLVNNGDFKRLIATLRLAAPYTGLICTARESAQLRREVMAFGVSQIDAGSRIELGGYTEIGDATLFQTNNNKVIDDRNRVAPPILGTPQFALGDIRPLDEVVRELLADGYIPSWCTSCYRLGRTGEHFMELAIPGFIQRFCTPNALSTLMEYLMDYASPETRAAGEKLIAEQLAKMPDSPQKKELARRLEAIRTTDQRDLYV